MQGSTTSLLEGDRTGPPPEACQWPRPTPSSRSIGRKLEDLSINLMEAFNGNIEMDDYLFSCMHENVVFNSGQPGAESTKTNPKDHVARIRKFYSTHQSWKIHASNPSSLVDEEAGKAEVYATSTISGYLVDLARERVTKTKWKRICGNWKVVEHNVMIGGGLPPVSDDMKK